MTEMSEIPTVNQNEPPGRCGVRDEAPWRDRPCHRGRPAATGYRLGTEALPLAQTVHFPGDTMRETLVSPGLPPVPRLTSCAMNHPPAKDSVNDDHSPRPDRITKAGIDTTVPHAARVWNYWLGGKDNYAVDRKIGDEILAVFPAQAEIARSLGPF